MAAGAAPSAGAAPPELEREAQEEADEEQRDTSTETYNIQKEKASSIGAPVNLLGRKSADFLRFFLSLSALVFIILKPFRGTGDSGAAATEDASTGADTEGEMFL